MIVKVCGMREPDNIAQVAQLKIDMMGFIFYPKSSRCVGDEVVGVDLCRRQNIQRVGVFVNETTERMVEIADRHQLDLLQLHGNESPEQCAQLRAMGRSVIKALAFRSIDDVAYTSLYDSSVDLLLFDTPSLQHGGTGVAFDWSFLQAYTGTTPFLLSGGIGLDSLNSLRHFGHPLWVGIDVNSRFEIKPAFKRIETLEPFVQTIKANY